LNDGVDALPDAGRVGSEKKVKPETAKRMMRFAIPYAGLRAFFLLVVIGDAGIGVVNPRFTGRLSNNGFRESAGAAGSTTVFELRKES
jgi:hypothetical protein